MSFLFKSIHMSFVRHLFRLLPNTVIEIAGRHQTLSYLKRVGPKENLKTIKSEISNCFIRKIKKRIVALVD